MALDPAKAVHPMLRCSGRHVWRPARPILLAQDEQRFDKQGLIYTPVTPYRQTI